MRRPGENVEVAKLDWQVREQCEHGLLENALLAIGAGQLLRGYSLSSEVQCELL